MSTHRPASRITMMMMMIFIGTQFCNLHRDANGLHLRQTSVQPTLRKAKRQNVVSSIRDSSHVVRTLGVPPFSSPSITALFLLPPLLSLTTRLLHLAPHARSPFSSSTSYASSAIGPVALRQCLRLASALGSCGEWCHARPEALA